MTPKTVLPVNDQTLPLVLKYQDKEYLIKSTAGGNLHMSKCGDERPIPPPPPPPPPDEPIEVVIKNNPV